MFRSLTVPACFVRRIKRPLITSFKQRPFLFLFSDVHATPARPPSVLITRWEHGDGPRTMDRARRAGVSRGATVRDVLSLIVSDKRSRSVKNGRAERTEIIVCGRTVGSLNLLLERMQRFLGFQRTLRGVEYL